VRNVLKTRKLAWRTLLGLLQFRLFATETLNRKSAATRGLDGERQAAILTDEFLMPQPASFMHNHWHELSGVAPTMFICGYCDSKVSSEKGFPILNTNSRSQVGGIFICPNCRCPTFITPGDRRQIPGSPVGNNVAHVPEKLSALYGEARDCVAGSSFTASVLICRKMLMNIAVEQGADQNLKFIEYVDYLAGKGFVPPHGKHWVDHIRKKGNEATHEIALMTNKDATELIVFIEMLLKFIYEFPNSIPKDGSK
jgi:Domain of unknown function (DUF4145)